jgi:ubiquitin-protein ligase
MCVFDLCSPVIRCIATLPGFTDTHQSDIFEWHCTVRGVQGTDYEGGE